MYQAPDMSFWKGRVNPNPEDLLFHQVIKPLDLTNDVGLPTADYCIALIGYMCDEGVRRNFGRVGARSAPETIRKAMTGMAVHFDTDKIAAVDAGNVICAGENLESSFKILQGKVEMLLANQVFPIVIGGGHETAYPHFSAVQNYHAGMNVGIINLDAHFDLRNYENGPHSGSPFRHIADDAVAYGRSFNYLPIGIRPESNVKSMFDFMESKGQQYVLLNDVKQNLSLVCNALTAFADRMDKIYLTIDMDCLPAGYAPGVSAPGPDGLVPSEISELINAIPRDKLVSMDVVEVNPKFDIDGRTSRLAASLISSSIQNEIS